LRHAADAHSCANKMLCETAHQFLNLGALLRGQRCNGRRMRMRAGKGRIHRSASFLGAAAGSCLAGGD
jgi:hypothetical protein